jgi:hypothetical protein
MKDIWNLCERNWSTQCEIVIKQGYQNRDFTSSRKGVAKSGLVKSQSKSKDFLLKDFCRIDVG